ncbi:MAG: LysM peptidoglycan-binding domain-containing protein [Candidatus Coprenecus sp.]|nr:LysM peptidoglycan-binding domain-containing protein [Candidatus Coprenecus sp.]
MTNKRFLTTLLITILVSPAILQAKPLFKSESKKDLRTQRDSLMMIVDSLRRQVDSLLKLTDAIAMSDTTTVGDTLNSGGFVSFLEANGDYDIVLENESVTIDSLLGMWYHKRDLTLVEMEPSDIDSAIMLSNVPDSVYLNRLRDMNSFISLPYNNIIRNHIIYYTEKMPQKMETVLGLAAYYMPIFEAIFDSYDLPIELTAMAVIESALNTKAVSRARAKGMWQFMYSTAKRYGLTINSYVDERYDPITSAHAAAQYLRDSYLIFNDWPLAIASYNCGAGNVNKAIRRSGGGKSFWEVYRYLPRETRGYVPSFIAALYSMRYYKEHNLTPTPVVMPPHLDTIAVNKMLHFDQIAHYTGISVEELRTHNPQYIHDIIPGVERQYILRLPYQYTPSFIDNEAAIYKYRDSIYFNPSTLKKLQNNSSIGDGERITHKVRKGETLSHISMKYGVSVNNIRRWNGIKGNNIRVGQKIVIYSNNKGPASSSSASSKTSSGSKSDKSSVKTTEDGGYLYYTVKSGDNLWDIAKKFDGVSYEQIMKINGFTKKSKIYPGNKIKIKKL